MKMLLEFDHKKATQAINYLAKKEGGKIDKLKLLKLVYFADRYHIRRYGRPMLNDAYLAMPLGPVASSVKDIAQASTLNDAVDKYAQKYISPRRKRNRIDSVADVDFKVFSKSEIEALDFAYNKFGQENPIKIALSTHRYPEWKKFETMLKSQETTVVPMLYMDFFLNPENGENDPYAMSEETLNASKEAFEENYHVAEYWR